MPAPEEIWLPLVDEPIGDIVDEIQREHPEIAALVESPHRILAFRTFAYIRVGLKLGELLVDSDVEPTDRTWVESLLAAPEHKRALVDEVRSVAEEIAADPDVFAVAVSHRVGVLAIGDVALVAAVSTAHRAAAFAACARLVDEAKARLPIWKRQVFTDGTDEWVNCP